jgi:ABC-type transport system substrate-binding protein
MPGYNPELRAYDHDPAKAKELLAEAGFGDGMEVEMLTRDRPDELRVVEAVQEDLGRVGARVVVRPVSFPQWLDLTGKRGEVGFTINAWYQDYPDPSNFLEVLLSGDRITALNCPNRAFYDNPEVTRLLRRAHAMTDLPARLQLYQQIEQMVVDDAPWIFLYYPTAYRLVQPWVHNYKLHPVWLTTEANVWLGPPGPG